VSSPICICFYLLPALAKERGANYVLNCFLPDYPFSFQSTIPGFKGEKISSEESLQSSASIRLLTHILREPLFDELRTKQQLGYIVHSYYDISFSSPSPQKYGNKPCTTPIDCIVINVLSKKVSPQVVSERIDSFLDDFRTQLCNTPESEIEDHAKALKTKLLKPIQKLGTEAQSQFGKIRRYGPEILTGGGVDKDLPWDNSKTMANAIGKLKREDLVSTWDRMVRPQTRSRVVSHVYGSTFPLPAETTKAASSRKIVDSVPGLLKFRGSLARFEGTGKTTLMPWRYLSQFGSNKVVTGAAVVALVGVGYMGITMLGRSKKTSR